MNRNFPCGGALLLAALLYVAPNVLMAQTNQTDAARWLAKSDSRFCLAASRLTATRYRPAVGEAVLIAELRFPA